MEANRLYSYFIIKPDGVKYFPEINSIIEQEVDPEASIRFFLIKQFDETIKKLYYKHFEKESFSKSYEHYLNASKSLFGNLGILIIVSTSKTSNSKEFFDKIFEIKHIIRNKMIDPNVCAISNNTSSSEKNRVQIIDENGEEIKQRFFRDEGNYRISGFDIVHCPDPTQEDTYKELNILAELGIISNENMFDSKGIMELLRFRSAHGFDGDWTEHRPDIAGFIEKEIKDSDASNKEDR